MGNRPYLWELRKNRVWGTAPSCSFSAPSPRTRMNGQARYTLCRCRGGDAFMSSWFRSETWGPSTCSASLLCLSSRAWVAQAGIQNANRMDNKGVRGVDCRHRGHHEFFGANGFLTPYFFPTCVTTVLAVCWRSGVRTSSPSLFALPCSAFCTTGCDCPVAIN
jgi:hypothetical protein